MGLSGRKWVQMEFRQAEKDAKYYSFSYLQVIHSNPSSRYSLDLRLYGRPYKALVLACAPTVLRALSWPLRNGRAKEKVIRRHDCVRNLDTPLVCARRHQQMTMKCSYSSTLVQCTGDTRLGTTRGLHVGRATIPAELCQPKEIVLI